MILEVIVFCIGGLVGLYIDGVKQFAIGLSDWLNDKGNEPYDIKLEDYYDGRRDH